MQTTQPQGQNDDEQWRTIPGFEGHYEASDLGRIRSLDRTVPHGRVRAITVHGKILAPTMHKGRPHLTLVRDGRRHQVAVHVLVLRAFRGPRPAGMEGCHGDGDATNNRLSNLRWDTSSANNRDQVQHCVHGNGRKTHCPRRHLLEEPNLVAAGVRRGQRICRACARAATTLQHEGATKSSRFQAVADGFYLSFMPPPQEGAFGPLVEPTPSA